MGINCSGGYRGGVGDGDNMRRHKAEIYIDFLAAMEAVFFVQNIVCPKK